MSEGPSIRLLEARALAALRDAAAGAPPKAGGDGDITAQRLVMRAVARAWAAGRGLDPARLAASRLMREGAPDVDTSATERDLSSLGLDAQPVDVIGRLFERLLAHADRKRSGSFYTPPELARRVVEAALDGRGPCRTVCDPAMGAGVFLLAAGRALEARAQGASRRTVAASLHGIDLSPLAVAVAEVSLWLHVGDEDLDFDGFAARLCVADTIVEPPPPTFPENFDLVVGNPPWVAYAGRAAKPLSPDRRRSLARRYKAFAGYPTLQGLFVERAAQLATKGTVALIVPSPLADLDGYRPVRRTLTATHAPREPLRELGQDAFERVVQPSFVLIADAVDGGAAQDRPWTLRERQRATARASVVAVPEAVIRLTQAPTLPAELFGELGFQSAGDVSRRLFLRAEAPDADHTVPLLQGRDVSEFQVRAPRLYLHPDPEVMARSRCRLRPLDEYRRARFVVRQTAAYPIAAMHSGHPFRNSLLAGFSHEQLAPEIVVALLNSSLFRALHVARQRDARQAAFPQMKIRHLRSLPMPPAEPARFEELARITRAATSGGISPDLRSALDGAVFALFALDAAGAEATRRFLIDHAPRLA